MTLNMIMIRQTHPFTSRSWPEILWLYDNALGCKSTGEERGVEIRSYPSPSPLQQGVIVRLVRNDGLLKLFRMAAT